MSAGVKVERTVVFGEELFEFISHRHWVDYAQSYFAARYAEGFAKSDIICVDMFGQVCTRGLHFQEAKERGLYPIKAYAVRRRAQQS